MNCPGRIDVLLAWPSVCLLPASALQNNPFGALCCEWPHCKEAAVALA